MCLHCTISYIYNYSVFNICNIYYSIIVPNDYKSYFIISLVSVCGSLNVTWTSILSLSTLCGLSLNAAAAESLCNAGLVNSSVYEHVLIAKRTPVFETNDIVTKRTVTSNVLAYRK